MPGWLSREELLIGHEAVERLAKARVAVIGVGGVGSFAAEGLIRAGVGRFLLVDGDTVSETNINRQIHATTETVGMQKADVMKKRMLAINPLAEIETVDEFLSEKNIGRILHGGFDYIIDAVDTVAAKIALAVAASREGIPAISSMGAGNKLDPTAFEVADIFSTSVCPLARVMRRELKKRGVPSLKVVFSKEPPIKSAGGGMRAVPGSVSFVPSAAGLIIAGEVVKDIIGVRA